VIRSTLALGLALAIQVGALCTPFLHAHVGVDHDDHPFTAVHAHFSSHGPGRLRHHGVSVEEADHDHPIYLKTFIAEEAAAFQPPALPGTVFAPVLPVDRAPRQFALVTHGHDPPAAHQLDSRPPPFFRS